jgi:hypothetical protein
MFMDIIAIILCVLSVVWLFKGRVEESALASSLSLWASRRRLRRIQRQRGC